MTFLQFCCLQPVDTRSSCLIVLFCPVLRCVVLWDGQVQSTPRFLFPLLQKSLNCSSDSKEQLKEEFQWQSPPARHLGLGAGLLCVLAL